MMTAPAVVDVPETIAAMCEAAGHDERLVDGALYLKAAALIRQQAEDYNELVAEKVEIAKAYLEQAEQIKRMEQTHETAVVDVPADVRPERVLMQRRLQGPTDLCENEWYPWEEVFGPDMTIRQPETYEYAWFILQTSESPIPSAPASPSHPDTE